MENPELENDPMIHHMREKVAQQQAKRDAQIDRELVALQGAEQMKAIRHHLGRHAPSLDEMVVPILLDEKRFQFITADGALELEGGDTAVFTMFDGDRKVLSYYREGELIRCDQV